MVIFVQVDFVKLAVINTDFLAPPGAQEVFLLVCLSICLSVGVDSICKFFTESSCSLSAVKLLIVNCYCQFFSSD